MQLFVFEPKQHECILNPFGLYPQITTWSPDHYLVTGNLVQNSGGDEERVYLAATQETSHVRIGLCILIVRTFLGESNGTPLQDPCLENPMDRGAWWAAVHGVAKSRTRLSDFTFTFHFHALEKEMATHSSVLAWRIPGTGELGGLPSMGSHGVGHH